jgi:hypothetical protein
MKIAVYGLIYGDYHKLHKRFAESLFIAMSSGTNGVEFKTTIWGNQPCTETVVMMKKLERPDFKFVPDKRNTPKYTLMREKLFNLADPDSFDWMVWFDDDSWLTNPYLWVESMLRLVYGKKDENICYIGEPWWWHWRAGQWDFVKQSTWFKGVPPELDHKGRPRVTFAQGGLWWLRSDVRKMLDWPDARLSHNGGDTLLGEAIRQQSLPFHKVHKSKHGFRTNDAERRGLSEKPAGQR